jgi:hypothetical protein
MMTLLGMACWLLAVGLVVYGFIQKEPDEPRERTNMRLAWLIAVVLFFAGAGLQAIAGIDLPSPAPGPGPAPVPPPPAPGPTGFAQQIQAAFKADGGTRNQALILGGLADQFGELVPLNPDKFREHEDVGAQWEKLRGLWLPEIAGWAPKTLAVVKAELAARGLVQVGPLDDAGRQRHGDFYEDVGEALLSYE